MINESEQWIEMNKSAILQK